jgi:hypothetical protein
MHGKRNTNVRRNPVILFSHFLLILRGVMLKWTAEVMQLVWRRAIHFKLLFSFLFGVVGVELLSSKLTLCISSTRATVCTRSILSRVWILHAQLGDGLSIKTSTQLVTRFRHLILVLHCLYNRMTYFLWNSSYFIICEETAFYYQWAYLYDTNMMKDILVFGQYNPVRL